MTALVIALKGFVSRFCPSLRPLHRSRLSLPPELPSLDKALLFPFFFPSPWLGSLKRHFRPKRCHIPDLFLGSRRVMRVRSFCRLPTLYLTPPFPSLCCFLGGSFPRVNVTSLFLWQKTLFCSSFPFPPPCCRRDSTDHVAFAAYELIPSSVQFGSIGGVAGLFYHSALLCAKWAGSSLPKIFPTQNPVKVPLSGRQVMCYFSSARFSSTGSPFLGLVHRSCRASSHAAIYPPAW